MRRNRRRQWQEGRKVGQREDDEVEEKEKESGEARWRERYQREKQRRDGDRMGWGQRDDNGSLGASVPGA